MNRTQCPNCKSVFLISDHQYRISKGKVRCGSCRQPFYAEFLPEPGAENPASADTDNTPVDSQRSDWQEQLRDMQADWHLGDGKEKQSDRESEEPEQDSISFSEPSFNSLFSENLHSELSIEFDDEESVDTPSSDSESTADEDAGDTESQSFARSLLLPRRRPRQEPQLPQVVSPPDSSDRPTDNSAEQPSDKLANESIDEPAQEQSDEPLTAQLPTRTTPADELSSIDGEDVASVESLSSFDPEHLQDSAVSGQPDSSETIDEAYATEAFSLDGKDRQSAWTRWILKPLALILSLVLLAALLTQLWYRQWLPQTDNPLFQKIGQPLLERLRPIQESLQPVAEEKLGTTVPARRDLAKLFLMSTSTEPHPSRSSTILLRVGMVNRAQIPQPWPWLELSLTDEAGRLISRRNLDPADYLYNNVLPETLVPNELRQVTIELLSFPQMATGYELKILNK